VSVARLYSTSALQRSLTAVRQLRQNIRAKLFGSQQSVSRYHVKGIHFGTDRPQSAFGVAVRPATKRVRLVVANTERIERAVNLNALTTLNRVAMPTAELVMRVAERIEEGSRELVKCVSGNLPTKALTNGEPAPPTKKITAFSLYQSVSTNVTFRITLYPDTLPLSTVTSWSFTHAPFTFFSVLLARSTPWFIASSKLTLLTLLSSVIRATVMICLSSNPIGRNFCAGVQQEKA